MMQCRHAESRGTRATAQRRLSVRPPASAPSAARAERDTSSASTHTSSVLTRYARVVGSTQAMCQGIGVNRLAVWPLLQRSVALRFHLSCPASGEKDNRPITEKGAQVLRRDQQTVIVGATESTGIACRLINTQSRSERRPRGVYRAVAAPPLSETVRSAPSRSRHQRRPPS